MDFLNEMFQEAFLYQNDRSVSIMSMIMCQVINCTQVLNHEKRNLELTVIADP